MIQRWLCLQTMVPPNSMVYPHFPKLQMVGGELHQFHSHVLSASHRFVQELIEIHPRLTRPGEKNIGDGTDIDRIP